MDEIDRASEIEAARIESSLLAIRREVESRPDEQVGICIEEDCGEDIEPERLAVVPNAKRCYRCQELYERPRRVRRF